MGKSGNPAKAGLKGVVSWFSNSPTAPTGYGVQSKQVIDRLVRDGLDVAVLSNYGREGVNGFYDSAHGRIPEYARGADVYSQDVTPLNHVHHVATVKKQKPGIKDVLVTLYDVWVLKGEKYDGLNVASWTPIDHSPVPPNVAAWCMKPNVTPIAMSRFGQAALKAVGIESEYVPHAVEKVFKPTFEVNGKPIREYMGISDDVFVVGMNFANKAAGLMHRKAVAEAFMAFKLFADKHPNSVLYIHSDMFGAFGGWKLGNLLTVVGLNADQVLFCDQIQYRYGISQDELAAVYSAMDVLLAPSYGEGFGVATIEAQACGTPVIVSDFAASAELVGDGWLIPCQPVWDEAQMAWFAIPSIPAMVEALTEAYERPRGKSQKAIDFAADYDADVVYDKYWLPVLNKLLK
jgi:glycosyltransferase involved in cell wall biosynthesis